MDDAHDPETERTRYMRLPWPLVAVGLLGIVVVALAAGLFANRYLRPQVGLVPTPVPVAVDPLATTAPTPQPTLTPQAQAPSSATATAQPATVAPTPAPVAVVSPTPSALPTVEPALAEEVGNAYVTFWRVRSQALLELDATHLSEVMDGDYLQNFAMRLDDLRLQGRAIKTQVTLNYTVVQANEITATIFDRIEDTSVYILPGTEQPLSDQTDDVLLIEFKLMKADGAWRVVDSVRQE